MNQRTRRRQTSHRYSGPLTLMTFHRLLKWHRALARSRFERRTQHIEHALAAYQAEFAEMVRICKPPIDHSQGDYVTRDGTDVHQLTRMGHCGDHGDYTCIVAPATGWCAVGDVEHNMARRYSKVEYTPGTATP
jgi:hypothetical protein